MTNPETRRLQVGSCELAVTITAADASGPPVLFATALGESEAEWDQVRARVRSQVPVVTYGRPTLDGSGPLPSAEAEVPRPIGWAADQLHGLLQAADLDGPPVLVGHSIGGQIVERFAYTWPEQLAGLVLVDASDMRALRNEPLLRDGDDDGAGILFDVVASQRDYDDYPNRPVPCPAVVLGSAVGRWHRAQQPYRYLPLTLAEVDAMWQEAQHRFAYELDAALVIAHTAGHRLEAETPGLVAYTIDAVIDATRTSRRDVELAEEALDSRGGYLSR